MGFFPLSPWKQQSRCSLSESRTSINKFSPRLWPLSSKSLVRSSCPNGLTLSRPTLPRNWLHMMRIGTTPDWHPWPDTFTLGLPSVSPQFGTTQIGRKGPQWWTPIEFSRTSGFGPYCCPNCRSQKRIKCFVYESTNVYEKLEIQSQEKKRKT